MSSLHQSTEFFLYNSLCALEPNSVSCSSSKKLCKHWFKSSSEILINGILLGRYEILSAIYE